MDEKGEFILSPDCLLEIMNYVITDCKSKDKNVKNDSSSFGDLIHFVLAHEFFLELLEVHYKRLYDDLEMAIACKIIKLLIELRLNKISSGMECCWSSYLESVREKSPFNLELSLGYHKEKRNHTNVCVSIKGISTDLANTEALKLFDNISTEDLSDICSKNPNLRILAFEGSKIHGSFSDITPHCENLEEVRIRLNPRSGVAQYRSLAKLPNLKTFIITGVQESGSQLLFFNDLRTWSRPKSLQPLTLTIEDSLSDESQPITFATFDSLRYLHINEPYRYNDWYNSKLNVLIKSEYDLSETSEDSTSIKEYLATITLGKYVKVKFNRCKEELVLKIHQESDISKMGSLSKLPNLSRLVVHNKCSYLDYPNTLAEFLRSMKPNGSFGLKSCKINYGIIDKLESIELSKIESIRFLACHQYSWCSTKFLSQLSNLQHLKINVRREWINGNSLEVIVNLLTACQVTASIMTEELSITLKKNEKEMEILFSYNSFKADILAPLSQISGFDSLKIAGGALTGYLNPVFKAFATSNLTTINEIDLSELDKPRFEDIIEVAEIKTIKKLTCSISDFTGIEKLANLNKLEDLSVFGKGNLSPLFIKLAERDSIHRFQCSKELDPEEVINVSKIGSLKHLNCKFLDVENLKSLSALANSSIEELIVTSYHSFSLKNLFAAFSKCNASRLQQLEVIGKALDFTEIAEVSKIKGLKKLLGFFDSNGAQLLDRLINLEHLEINVLNVVALKSLPRLQKLEIKNEIGLLECKHLVELEKLESLKCSLCKDPGIEVLAKMKNLKELIIYRAEDSLCRLYRAFGLGSESKLRELHIPIRYSEEIREISKIKSLTVLDINYEGICDNLSDLGQLNELKSLRIAAKCSVDSDSLLPIIQFCQKLDCVTLEFIRGLKVAVKFVSKANTILKSIRDPLLQKPLQLTLCETSVFPKFHVEDIDDSYLNVFYSYDTEYPDEILDFMSDGAESDDSDSYDVDWYY
ncbi:uncharacterized protein LOC108037500 [Drosophila rhopaloa]|uniref:Uncharacterized protein LOC108037500 n=1 Tax=Drosophila rhopaloa TaxID=1041015 RepID=A0A6P4E7Z9_DRORH|nr:uncharacterized protein LOC108037500 [Drosophila rhopaloa]